MAASPRNWRRTPPGGDRIIPEADADHLADGCPAQAQRIASYPERPSRRSVPAGPAGSPGLPGPAGPTGPTGADGAQEPTRPQGPSAPRPQGPAGPGGTTTYTGTGSGTHMPDRAHSADARRDRRAVTGAGVPVDATGTRLENMDASESCRCLSPGRWLRSAHLIVHDGGGIGDRGSNVDCRVARRYINRCSCMTGV